MGDGGRGTEVLACLLMKFRWKGDVRASEEEGNDPCIIQRSKKQRLALFLLFLVYPRARAAEITQSIGIYTQKRIVRENISNNVQNQHHSPA